MARAGFGFYTTDVRDAEDLVRRTLDICKSSSGFEIGAPDETVEPEQFFSDEGGAFNLDWQDGPGRVSVTFTHGTLPETFLELSTRREVFVPEDGEGEYQELTGAVVELVRKLAVEHGPYYVVSPDQEIELGSDPTHVMPMTTDFELERIPWFGIYSEALIEDLGGRDHVLETPAWHVEELDTGSILVIRTRAPWAKLGRDHPVDRHLLGEDA